MATRLTRVEQQQRTRRALLDAAGEMFVERGFLGASVEAIAERAGYTRGAFYSNFSSKEALFAELLQERVYAVYRAMAEQALADEHIDTPRESGERLAAVQAHPDGHWMFRLWLELIAHAGRDDAFRTIAAEFWRTNREVGAKAIEHAVAASGRDLKTDSRTLMTAAIALDVGLSLQHFVDPERAPLSMYPDAFEALYRGATAPWE